MKNDKMFNTKLSRSKKGINDISIITIILAIFLVTAFMVELINDEFGAGYDEYDIDGVVDSSSAGGLTPWRVFFSAITLAGWDIDGSLGLPAWFQLLYTLLTIVLILVIARNIWIGGGG